MELTSAELSHICFYIEITVQEKNGETDMMSAIRVVHVLIIGYELTRPACPKGQGFGYCYMLSANEKNEDM